VFAAVQAPFEGLCFGQWIGSRALRGGDWNRLDPYYLGAKVGEQQRAVRTRDDTAKIENTEARHRGGGHTWRDCFLTHYSTILIERYREPWRKHERDSSDAEAPDAATQSGRNNVRPARDAGITERGEAGITHCAGSNARALYGTFGTSKRRTALGIRSNIGIFDAQIHVWKVSTAGRPWPADAIKPQREKPLQVPEVSRRMDEAGVSAAVLLPPTWEGSRNDYVLERAAAEPRRFAALCRFPTADPAEVEKVAHWRETPGMVGVRMSLNRGDVDGAVAAATSSGFFAAAEEHGLPLSIFAPDEYFRLYEHLAQTYPGLKITIDHAALNKNDRPLADAIEPVLPLAQYPHVAVKASALPCFTQDEYPFPAISEAVYRLVDAFGAERVFWGSDLSRLPIPYEQLVDVFVNHTPALSDTERSAVLGESLAAWLEWPRATCGSPVRGPNERVAEAR
jgi:L-fuconolactonase